MKSVEIFGVGKVDLDDGYDPINGEYRFKRQGWFWIYTEDLKVKRYMVYENDLFFNVLRVVTARPPLEVVKALDGR